MSRLSLRARVAGATVLAAAVVGVGVAALIGSPPSDRAALTEGPREESATARLCEHGVPAELCTKCNPDLAAVFEDMGDWCEKHGLPLSHCKECNPDLDFSAPDTSKDWCKEHGVPESMCTKCRPELVAKFITAGDYCREHGYPKSVCPRCNPGLVTARGEELPVFPEPGTRVRLASAATAKEAGIETTVVQARPAARVLEVVGRLDFDRNRYAEVSSRNEAVILAVNADIGDDVEAGEPLVVLASAAVGEEQARLAAAKARLETATAALRREESLAQNGIAARKSVEAARSELAAARGEHEAALAALHAAGAVPDSHGGRYVLATPIGGTVVGRDAVIGKTASPGQALIHVADLGTMWALLEIPEADAALVRPGQNVELHFEGLAGETRRASIGRVGASVDPQTRTVRARVDLPNPDRALKAGLFIRAVIQVSPDRAALIVPQDAVQWAEGRALVFVEEDEAVYVPVPVQLGTSLQGGIEVVKGLTPRARVVTTGAFLLKTEVLKDSIGAGCADEGVE
jgi:cobalt-zinc-cadmium efflux system membrane fusion protein